MADSSVNFVKKNYEIFADYNQFYLMDAANYSYALENYTDEDVRLRIKAEKYIAAILPERNMTVPVELEVPESSPNVDFEEWQHVAEASLELPSGKLRIEECTSNEPVDEIILSPTTYRIRAYYGDLDKLSFDGLDGDDHYKIILWQAPFEDVKVLKQFEDGNSFE